MSILTNPRLALAVGAALLCGASTAFYATSLRAEKTAADDPVVAVVNGSEIHRSKVSALLSQIQGAQEAPLEMVFPMIIDQIINSELVSQEAARQKLSDDPEVAKRLADAKEQIVRGLYLERVVAKRVDDAAVKAEYEKLKKEHKGKQETRAHHILLKTEEEAKAVIAELKGGANFAELAKAKSIDPAAHRGGDLGYFVKEAMVPEFAEAAFKQKVGTHSEKPVQTKFGWHVIFVEDRRDIQIPAFEEVEGPIRNKLNQEALETVLKDLRKAAKIERFSLNGEPLN